MPNRKLPLVMLPAKISPLGIRTFRVATRNVDLKRGHLVWSSETDLEKRRRLGSEPINTAGTVIFEDFVSLYNQGADRVIAFARKYGPLSLCKHGFALRHRKRDFEKRCFQLGHVLGRGVHARESLAAWKMYIDRAKGILTVSNKLRLGVKPTKDDWHWIDAVIPRPQISEAEAQRLLKPPEHYLCTEPTAISANDLSMLPLHYLWRARNLSPVAAMLRLKRTDPIAENPMLVVPASAPRDGAALASAINVWLDECEISLSVTWAENGPEFKLGPAHPLGLGHSLLGVIGVQLVRAVLQHDIALFCSYCGRLYRADRLPRTGEKNYCNGCGRKVANKLAQRKFRKLHTDRTRRKSLS